tara:strand:+ start:59 stop:595 length:537 start_codon:yes stop_codon:yes gene_type:complete
MRVGSGRQHALLLGALLLQHLARRAAAQGYGYGIGKSTVSCSDPDAALSWMLANLPSLREAYRADGCTDDTHCTCGVVGRVYTEPLRNRNVQMGSAAASSGGAHFGLHTVAVTSGERPSGAMGVAELEAHYAAKLAATPPGGYDAFMDFSTGFWVSDLDPCVAGVNMMPHLLWLWSRV